MKKTIVLAAIIFAATVSLQAQTAGNENMNLKGEKARVRQGVKSGEIKKNEARVIKKQALDVQQAKNKAKADGVVTKKEKVGIAKQDRQLDRTIRRTKHNGRKR